MAESVDNMVIGVVGVGTMGLPIASRLRDVGRTVLTYDIAPKAISAASDVGLRVAADLFELATACNALVFSLPEPKDVLASVEALASNLSCVPKVFDMSTIDPQTAERCHELLCATGGAYADCPVLGRPSTVGNWTLPIGADRALFQVASALLDPLARRIVNVGPVGCGQTVKILNNLMFGAINAITAEVLVLARSGQLDPGVFVDTVIESGAASVSGLFKDIGPAAVAGDFAPTFRLSLLHKDNRLAVEMASRLGVPLPVGNAIQTLNTMAVSAGYGAEDSIAVIKILEQIVGRESRRSAQATPSNKG